jgi:hypothetical protein
MVQSKVDATLIGNDVTHIPSDLSMKTFIGIQICFLLLLTVPPAAQGQEAVGLWTFDDPENLTAAQTGPDLTLTGTHEPAPGIDVLDGAARIGVGSHYHCLHGLPGNGGGSLVNEYTLVFDVQTFGRGLWHCLLQTYAANTNDGDVFISQPGRVGVSATGYSFPRVLDAKTWYRLAIVVDNGSRYEIYADGLLILSGTPQGVDGRFSLDPGVLFFADDNGEDGELDVSRIALYDQALSAAAIEALGGLGGMDAFVTPPFLQNVKTDGITVMWESEASETATVEYGLDTGYGDNSTAVSVDSANQTWIHTAVLSGLQPATTYHFRVTWGDVVGEDGTFTTAPADETSFSFAIWSDSQGYNGGDYPRDPTEPSKSMFDHMVAEGMDFAVTCGDLAESGGSYTDTRVFFVDRPVRRLGAQGVPFFIAWGNHDGGSGDVIRSFADLPSKDRGAPYHGGYGSFSFDYAGCHFICIDYQLEQDDIPGWLEEDLQSSAAQEARFIFLFVHRPPYCERWVNGQAYLRDYLVPLLEQYGVDACFSGHMHGYNRGLLNDVHYCVTGGASWLDHHEPLVYDWPHMTVGGYHDLAPDIVGGLVHEYVRVTVTPGSFTAEMLAFDPDGTYRGVLDSFGKTDMTPVEEGAGHTGRITSTEAWPNPFNPRTWIAFRVDGQADRDVPTRLRIYDARGLLVRVLLDDARRPGDQRIPWDGCNDRGEPLPSGVYLYRVEAGNQQASGKVTLLR